MRLKCKIGIHNFDSRIIEFSTTSPAEASIVEVCACGKHRVVGRKLPTLISFPRDNQLTDKGA